MENIDLLSDPEMDVTNNDDEERERGKRNSTEGKGSPQREGRRGRRIREKVKGHPKP